ncbi:MAG: glycoside hydrolase family 9 protein [Ruminococcus sp.]|nr:glycoside hydrolase family 9 protein [Ruminococcus sp.]
MRKKFNKVKSAILSGMIAATSIAGSFAMTAPALSSSAASDDYAKLLQYSLYFYDANMCGDQVGETSGMTWRDDCHTGDEVKGGFHDAGDHVMFGLPQGYSASTLGWGYYEFKDAYNATGQAKHFKTVSDYFCKFFKDSTKLDGSGNVTNFLYQKGEGDPDHSYWNAPEKQEQEQGTRKMYWTSNSGSDIAAEYAAALALNYLNFGNAEDLKYAEALYKFSTQYNQVATDGTTPFYTSNSCTDEQAWAAGWLYIATGNESYKTDCANKQKEYLWTNHCWENVELGAACVYAEITKDWSKVNEWLGRYTNSNDYAYVSEWGSARTNAAIQLTALVASKNSSADYSSWVKGQMDFLLGNNPLNVCYVVGFDSNSAKNPHHRAASGMTNWDEFNASDVITNGHTLVGALVGGPKDKAGTNYTDTLKDAVCNEVAVDYNAAFVGAAAGLYDIYKTGSVVSSIEGVDKIYNEAVSGPTNTTPTQSSQTTVNTTQSTPTQTTPSQSSGVKEIKPNYKFDYANTAEDERMIGWKWSEFGLGANDKPTKVEITISANGTIGKWQGAFGSSTKVQPDYWTMSDEMEQTFSGNTATITWNIDSATSEIIQTQYNGEIKFGTWWVDCKQFTVDSVKVYTGDTSSVTQPVQSTQSTPSTNTTQAPVAGPASYELKLNQSVDYTALPKDDKMIGWEWSKFNIKSGEKPTKVEINISANSAIGKWQGAFGSSTQVQPEYWTQTDDMEQTFSGNSATITWNIDSATSSIIQTQYGGELKFGIWWIDCKQFNIDSIKVYTDGTSSTPTTQSTQSTAKTTQSTQNQNTKVTVWGDANCDGKVTIADATAIIQALGNEDEYALSAQGAVNADVVDNGDGVTGADANAIQAIEAGFVKQTDFPMTKTQLDSAVK